MRQGAQALDPAAAHAGGGPGGASEGSCLPKEPGQQLPLLGSGEGSGDLGGFPGDGHFRGGFSTIQGWSRHFLGEALSVTATRKAPRQPCLREVAVATGTATPAPAMPGLPCRTQLLGQNGVVNKGPSLLSVYFRNPRPENRTASSISKRPPVTVTLCSRSLNGLHRPPNS